jgi:hypothetical protein
MMNVIRMFVALFAIGNAMAQADDYERAPINYSASEAKNPVSELQKRIEKGDHGLDMSSEKAFLESVLKVLNVPKESQMLVYSKTSLQNDLITPQRPRALYFSEDCYVGWVQHGDVEIIIIDDVLGPVFYRMHVPDSFPAEFEIDEYRPVIERSRGCLTCHGGTRTNNYPGMMVRSVRADSIGAPIYSAGTHFTDPASPIGERWGGWFVTGSHDGVRHMGNLIFAETGDGGAEVEEDMGVPLENLDRVLNVKPYLSNTSDIVALMVLEHQAEVHNVLTKALYSTLLMFYRSRDLAKLTGEDPNVLSETSKRIIDSLTDDMLDAMLFRNEFELKGWGVEGSEAFQEAFGKAGRKDAEGRSLREFNLVSHVFRSRLSYMIYSRSFDSLPQVVKETFYQKLWDALRDDEDVIGKSERERILAILRGTKEGLPVYWK